jgi:hypothetical protein
VDGTGYESCPMASFDINGFEPSGSVIRTLIICICLTLDATWPL